MRVALFAVSALLLASPALAQVSAAPPAKKEVKKDDPNRIICTRVHVVGSNRPQKVCMTVAERERAKEQTRDLTDESRRSGVGQGPAGKGPGR